ncbi:MAG: helix-turn-helix transcriptional regulator [Clostridia bacterium]|nr:helix-turn-helix transcriptional regulator [Clostridia bacterium]
MKKSELVENKRHGTLDFPVEYYYVDRDSPRYVMPVHWHREFEIIRVLSGSFTVYLNNVELDMKAGESVLLEGGCLHRGEPCDCVYECLVFDPNMLIHDESSTVGRYVSDIAASRIETVRTVEHDSELNKALERLFEISRSPKPFYELALCGALLQVFSLLYRENGLIPTVKTAHNRQTEAIVNLISWIEKNYTESITLERLSEVSGFNKKYLCRVFKEYTSKTVIEYINTLRLEKACIDMKTKSITESAYDSGFNDLSYFCKVFKSQLGMTPGEYKKAVLHRNEL